MGQVLGPIQFSKTLHGNLLNPPPKREDSERNSTQTEPRMELTTFGEFINFAVMNSLNFIKETSLIKGKTVGK